MAIEAERNVNMAAQLYEMRATAKRILGERYMPHMAELGKILQMTAERDGVSPLSVAKDVCTTQKVVGMDLMIIMAAAVELIEPSGD